MIFSKQSLVKVISYLVLLVLLVLSSTACSKPGNKLIGDWKNDRGQTLVFNNDNSALWIFNFNNKIDTFHINYKADFNTTPVNLDLYNFTTGPLVNKTLYGIIKFENDYFLCDFEAGTDETVRPKDFNPKESQKYFKKGLN